ncbi:hypothetical protein CK203_092564 [Vitis vinifera]|uniref:Uncharacterized protein n=1 Tax=Vitis vinifera TaxID=29760 RepID=A0A438CVI0_VITVI|nr:hypothetical protein CK203_092564 [Vitis vinifera]
MVFTRSERGVWCWAMEKIRMDWDFAGSMISFLVDIWDPLAEGGWGEWNPCFSRAFNDWEVEEAKSFLERLHGKGVCTKMWKTWCFGPKQRVESSWSYPSTMF